MSETHYETPLVIRVYGSFGNRHLAQYGGLPMGIVFVRDGVWDWDDVQPIETFDEEY